MACLSLHSPVGDLTIFAEDDAIVALDWGWGSHPDPSPLLRRDNAALLQRDNAALLQRDNAALLQRANAALLQRAKTALEDYFDGKPLADLPLAPAGTPYRQRVWAALRGIPAGQTRSYLEISRLAGGSPRAVGGANAANPIPILIPCHRVTGTANFGGYSGGEGLVTKRALLAFDKLGEPARP
jgi:methylated-DNA-[protein]-cysteine S-methyltransferase